ncbi:MAG: hypothetical protein AVDCRST_MAG35-2523, partial [uncultured Quadrisphaera sp.]
GEERRDLAGPVRAAADAPVRARRRPRGRLPAPRPGPAARRHRPRDPGRARPARPPRGL